MSRPVSKWFFVWVFVNCCAAQFFALKDITPPSQFSLSTVARYFVYSIDPAAYNAEVANHGIFGRAFKIPSHGWGLWDSPSPDNANLQIKGLGFKKLGDSSQVEGSEINSPFQLALMDFTDFWEEFMPYQQQQHFCCPQSQYEAKGCPELDSLVLPFSLRNRTQIIRVPFSSANDLSEMPTANRDLSLLIQNSGIHFLLAVNCSPKRELGSFEGSVTVKSSYGYLSGLDTPKLELYAVLTIVYAVIALLWLGLCLRFFRQLFKLHYLIGGVILIGLVEELVWYILLSSLNATTPSHSGLLLFAVGMSTVKNVSSIFLVLLVSLGYCITRPTLEKSTWQKVHILAVALTLFETLRQLATQYHVSMELSFVLLMLCALPITLIYSAVFTWSFFSLNAIMDELQERQQLAKRQQLSKFRTVLLVALFLFAISVTIETIAMASDIRNVWSYEWVFTDAVPNILFLLVLSVMIELWRPQRASKYYSYNLEIPTTDTKPVDADRIRANIQGRGLDIDETETASAIGVHNGSSGGNVETRDVRVWGELDLDLEEDSGHPVRHENA